MIYRRRPPSATTWLSYGQIPNEGPTTVSLEWNAPGSGGSSEIISYTLFINNIEQPVISASQRSFQASLPEYGSYNFYLMATNADNLSATSVTITINVTALN